MELQEKRKKIWPWHFYFKMQLLKCIFIMFYIWKFKLKGLYDF